MAITGRFEADFSNFIAAVDSAEIALVDLSKGSSKVEATLNRMTDSFSGRKLIQEASLMTVAIENAGGTSRLTSAELERVGDKANEAAEKMRKLGYEVPAGLQKLADETKGATSSFEGLNAITSSVVAGLVGFFSIRAGLNFVTDVVQQASALQDLSNQTHINVEDLQVLAGAMSQFGVTGDELGRALFTLSRRIAKGDDSVEVALGRMGLSLTDVKELQGEQLFMAMEHGLSQLQGGLRDTTASDLFGSKLGAAMAGASDGIDATVSAAHRLNTVMSAETVTALDTFGESLERAQRNMTAVAATMIGPLAQGFNVLFEAAEKGASKWDLVMGLLPKGLGLVGTGVEGLATAVDHANQEFAKNTGVVTAATNTQEGHAGAVAVTTASFKDQQKALADLSRTMAEMDKTTFDLAMQHEKQWREEAQKTMDVRNKAVIDGVTKIKAAEASLADEIAKQALSSRDYQIMKINEVADAALASFDRTTGDYARFSAAVIALAEEKKRVLMAASEDEAKAFTDAALKEAQAQDALNAAMAKTPEIAAAADRSVQQFTNTLVLGITNLDELNRALAKFYDQFAGNSVGTPGGGNVGTPVGNSAGMPRFAGARASGGPVMAGASYWVGEQGPELYTPSANGSITSTGGIGTTVNNTIYVNGTAEDVARKVAAEILRTVSAGQKLRVP